VETEIVTSSTVTEKSEEPYTTTVIIDNHSVVESKLSTVTVIPTSPISFTETFEEPTVIDGHHTVETITTTIEYYPTVYESVSTDYHTYRTEYDGHWETKTTTKTVTTDFYTTTNTIDGMPETFTESSTITTVNTAPVTITSIDTYETMVDGHEETKTITETDYYSNTSELPCYDRHLSRDSAWADNDSIVPAYVESWAPIGQWENGKAWSHPSN